MSDPIRTTIAPISPVSDHRVSHEVAVLEDVTYHYLLGVPDGGEFRGTVFLVSTYHPQTKPMYKEQRSAGWMSPWDLVFT